MRKKRHNYTPEEKVSDQRQLLFPFNDNYNSRLCCLT
jgi:hypothetical protein